MKQKPILELLFAAVLMSICTSAGASRWTGAIEGVYIPQRGNVQTMEVGIPAIQSQSPVGIQQPTQLGKFVILLARKGWSTLTNAERQRIALHVVIRGTIRGLTDLGANPPTTNHVLTNNPRDGALYTLRDQFVMVSAGDLECSQGVPLTGVEVINVVAGVGRYAGLVPGGKVFVQGTVNSCPGPGFLKNDFRIVSGAGGITFGPLQ